MTRQRYSSKESWNRIVRLFEGKPVPTDAPGAVTGEVLSEDAAISDLAELFAGSLPGETLSFPSSFGVATSYATFVIKTDTYTATSNDELIVCNKATAMTINLPAATGTGKKFSIGNVNTGQVTVDGNGSETINGETTQLVDQWACMDIVDYASGKWIII